MSQLLGTEAAEASFTLRDGRIVTYSDCGAKSGFPVLFFHPLQGNRLMGLLLHKTALQRKLRVIAPDRPGYGGSTERPSRTVAQYPRDVKELCSNLGIERFAIMASSCGSMYALSCTVAPETTSMVTGAVTLIPPWIPPSSLPTFSMYSALSTVTGCMPASVFTFAMQHISSMISRKLDKKGVKELLKKGSVEELVAFKKDPDFVPLFEAMLTDARHHQGDAGPAYEAQLCLEHTRHVGFSYKDDVSTPVRVYIGTADHMISPGAVKHWAEGASNVEVIVVDKGTHGGVMLTHADESMEKLVKDVRM